MDEENYTLIEENIPTFESWKEFKEWDGKPERVIINNSLYGLSWEGRK